MHYQQRFQLLLEFGADLDFHRAQGMGPEDLRGLDSFGADYPQAALLLLYRGTRRERRGRIWMLPVEDFLKNLSPARKLPV